MAEKIKKKPALFSLKSFRSVKDGNISPKTPSTPNGQEVKFFSSNSVNKYAQSQEPRPRSASAAGIKELVQCALCLEVLHNPKMLPCQHTFCMACLAVYAGNSPILECPICRTKIQVTSPNYISDLPSNLYIDSLLQLVGISNGSEKVATPPQTPLIPGMQSVELFAAGVRCTQCQTMCDSVDVTACEHCKMNFCRVCWSQHLDDMRTQVESILKQLEAASQRMEHKVEYYKDRCERITEQIVITADEKINAIIENKDKLLKEASELQKCGEMSALALKSSLEEAREVAKTTMSLKEHVEEKTKVSTYMNLHQNAVQLLSDVSKWDSERFVFDKENFRIEMDSATPLEAESDEPLPAAGWQNNPLESEESLTLHYRSRNFTPHYVWRKTARPCGVGISPWNNHLYVCGMDTHSVLVVERTQAKIVTRLTCEEMLCPVHIAFMKSLGEIYVTDKWKHCVHVFTKDGEYARSIGQKGSRVGMFRSPEGIAADNASQLLYVVDTGNDRVQILHPDGKFVDQIGVMTKLQTVYTTKNLETKEVTVTELNAPTSVAVTSDRVVVLDSGNRRVKVYNKADKSKINEFGSVGQRKGQFRQPEVLAVDPMGFILVGDSGNCRVQVFKQNGQLIRAFGGLGTEAGKFGWISGITVSKQLDIIVSDTKNHSVNFI